MTNKEYVAAIVKRAKAAAAEVEFYTQTQTDDMTKAVAQAFVAHGEELAQLALTETKMGTLMSKVIKNNIPGLVWNSIKNKPSVGVIDRDEEKGIITLAKPMGVIAGVAPSTNPTSTAGFYTTICLKGRNAIILAAHPRALNCTKVAVRYMREALESVGAPADLIQCLGTDDLPPIDLTNELTAELMAGSDAIIATGSDAMVKAAYSAGKPCFGVGQGNVQVVVDEDYDDFALMAENIIWSRPADNGVPCTGEQTIFVPKAKKQEIIDAFLATGKCYYLNDPAKLDQVRNGVFPNNGPINRAVCGQSPKDALAEVGVEIPECQLLLLDLEAFGAEEPLAREILFPVLRINSYDTFEQGVDMARTNLLNEGAGHSSSVYSRNEEHIIYAASRLPVARVMIEQWNSWCSGTTDYNGLEPTLSIGCGTWGGNAISENLEFRHLLNLTKVSYRLWDKTPTPPTEWFK